MKKVIVIGGSVILAGVIGMIVLAILNLGSIIKAATEKYGPMITQTEVKLGSADISVLSGSGSLSNFVLGNPKGFSMPSALECKTIRVKLVNDSLTTDTIVIDEIFLDSPVINYEQKGRTDNFKTIVNNIKKTVAGEKKEAKAKDTKAESKTGAEKKIVINNFIVKNGKINVSGPLVKALGDNAVGIKLNDIHIKDIGKKNQTTPAEAFAQILGQLTGNVGSSVMQITKELGGKLGKAVEDAADKSGVTGAIKGLFGD